MQMLNSWITCVVVEDAHAFLSPSTRMSASGPNLSELEYDGCDRAVAATLNDIDRN